MVLAKDTEHSVVSILSQEMEANFKSKTEATLKMLKSKTQGNATFAYDMCLNTLKTSDPKKRADLIGLKGFGKGTMVKLDSADLYLAQQEDGQMKQQVEQETFAALETNQKNPINTESAIIKPKMTMCVGTCPG